MTRNCPVCDAPPELATLFLEENFDKTLLTEFSFASRKEPEYMCHRLMQCQKCDLVYADDPPSRHELENAYHSASYDSSTEANDAAKAYIRGIQPILERLTDRKSALEIGTGSGIFLEHLRVEGFSDVIGIEPSAAAIANAPESRRKWIRKGIFRDTDFRPETFDLICCFMTMEHVADPENLVRTTIKLLRPGGAFITVTHNYRSFVNRILGKKSPIVDIEHLQLFSPKSIRSLFSRGGYSNVELRSFPNTYSLSYWARLAPLPKRVKLAVLSALAKTGAGDIKCALNVGNIIASGYRRE